MTQDEQLKLQAFFDGELSETEAREVANWIARDPDAAALQAELKNTRQALKGFEAEIKLPESREFYWSKIEREIRRSENQPERATVPGRMGWLRFLVPASALAAVMIIGLLASRDSDSDAAGGAELETEFADAGFTYRDEQEGVTLVWLSYGENGLANARSADTVQ